MDHICRAVELFPNSSTCPHYLEEMFRAPRDRVANLGQRGRPVDEDRDNHREPKVGIIGVRLSPAGRDPTCNAVILAPHICKRPSPKDWMLSPGVEWLCAANACGFALKDEFVQSRCIHRLHLHRGGNRRVGIQ